MTIEEENYWRGYIDAKVEDLGKTRTHHPPHATVVAYREELMEKYLPSSKAPKELTGNGMNIFPGDTWSTEDLDTQKEARNQLIALSILALAAVLSAYIIRL